MEDIIKICYHCKTPKLLEEFNLCKTGTFGVHGNCRSCQKIIRHEWYITHRKQEIDKNKLPHIKAKQKVYRNTKYHTDEKWRSELLLKNRERRKLEPAKVKARLQRKKWYSIPENKIACSLRVRIRKALREKCKYKNTKDLIGCSIEQLKLHLEKQFSEEMTWDNYGKWHIDHIIPCSFFNLTDPIQQKMCFNFRNLQPLWATENISKNNKITLSSRKDFLEMLEQSIT